MWFFEFLILDFVIHSKSNISFHNSDLISSITGGSAEIQDIQPYPFDGTLNVDRADFYEVDYYDRYDFT